MYRVTTQPQSASSFVDLKDVPDRTALMLAVARARLYAASARPADAASACRIRGFLPSVCIARFCRSSRM